MGTKKGKVQELIEEKFLEERKVFLWRQEGTRKIQHNRNMAVIERAREEKQRRTHNRFFRSDTRYKHSHN